jgi:EAL and modified HD-GYP domain-containing signal transduction protein
MQDHNVLGQVALGYSPMIDPGRAVKALRLTVFPEHPDATPDAAGLLAAIEAVWPPALVLAGERRLAPRVSLNLAGEALLRGVMAEAPGPHLMVEVPAFMVGDAANAADLRRLQAAGTLLLIKGRPLTPLPPELLSLFTHCILEPGEFRRDILGASEAASGKLTTVQAGARTAAYTDAAFKAGAAAVFGWPSDDEPPAAAGRSSLPSDVRTVMELMNAIEREEPVSRLEPILRRDPTLAFRLMRYLNSPAFGLPVEVSSFGHALMLLGYQRLKRWLALLLVSSAKGPNSKVLIGVAVRRGLLLEELGREHGDAEMRGEMFICGVFSLLPMLLQQPMADLLRSVPVPESVQQALRGEGGPYGAYLDLALAIEQESAFEIRELSERLLLGRAAVNRALLGALKTANDIEP